MYAKHFHTRVLPLLLCILLMLCVFPRAAFANGLDSPNPLSSASVADTEDAVGRVYDLARKLHDENSNSARTGGGFTWDTEGKKRSWTYYNGIMMDAFLMLDEEGFASYANAFYGANITSQGMVNSSGESDNYYRENELDSIPPARALFDLLRDPTTKSGSAEKYRKMIDYIYFLLQSHERVGGTDGNFKHKMNDVNWKTYQVALDGLYMAQPFLMELARAVDDDTLSASAFQYYTRAKPSSDQIYRDVIGRMEWIGDNLYVPETRLYSHGWGPDAGLSGQHWLRGVGWYAAALADVIGMLPDEYEEGRSSLVEIEERLFDGMMEYQDDATGMWYNVVNYGPELRGSVSGNELETSGTALIAYAMMKSYVEGYVDDTYGEAGLRAFNGTVKNYLDKAGLHNVYISSGVETTPEGYLGKEYKTNDAKGVGPLMMAATYANTAAAYHSSPVAKIIGGEDMSLFINEAPDFSGVSVLLEYANGTSLTATSEELTFGEHDSTVPGLQNVDVYYKDIYCGKIAVTFAERPSFASHSLVLSGQIGVNVFVDLPGDIAEYEGSYMAFFVNGKETDVPLNTAFMNSEKVSYGFTCHVNVLQMAEEITAIFHYGDDNAETIQTTVSVVGYLTDIKNNPSSFSSEMVELASAIWDYGYYCQQYLIRINNLEGKYAQMPNPETVAYDFDELAGLTDPYKVTFDGGGSAIDKASFDLVLNSSTVLELYFSTKSGFEGTPYVSVQGGEAFAANKRGDRYVVTIDDIPAHKLADMNEVSITADGECRIGVSALSYANAVLSGGEEEDAKNAMASLYNYYEKAMAYRASLQ